MADSTTTGSAVVGGTVGGLQKGLVGCAGSPTITDKLLFVYGSPQNVVTATTGSQIAFDIENNDIYTALAQNGSSWNRLGSKT